MFRVPVAVVMLAAALLAAAPSPDEVEARLRAGRSALAAREYAAAKNEFTAVLAADPANATAHLSLGIIALVEGDSVTGLRHFSRVPGDARALIGRLDCELRLGRITDARATAAQLNAMTAGNAAASGHVGTLLSKAGEYAAAAPFLRRAQGAAAANLLGTAEEKSGNLLGSFRSVRGSRAPGARQRGLSGRLRSDAADQREYRGLRRRLPGCRAGVPEVRATASGTWVGLVPGRTARSCGCGAARSRAHRAWRACVRSTRQSL